MIPYWLQSLWSQVLQGRVLTIKPDEASLQVGSGGLWADGLMSTLVALSASIVQLIILAIKTTIITLVVGEERNLKKGQNQCKHVFLMKIAWAQRQGVRH